MKEHLDFDFIIKKIKYNDIFSKIAQDWSYQENLGKFNKKRFSEQFLKFRESIKTHLVVLLYLEILLLSAILLLQGFGLGGFSINNWAFGFFVNGCLVQTFFLIKYIVKHLFPEANQKDSKV